MHKQSKKGKQRKKDKQSKKHRKDKQSKKHRKDTHRKDKHRKDTHRKDTHRKDKKIKKRKKRKKDKKTRKINKLYDIGGIGKTKITLKLDDNTWIHTGNKTTPKKISTNYNSERLNIYKKNKQFGCLHNHKMVDCNDIKKIHDASPLIDSSDDSSLSSLTPPTLIPSSTNVLMEQWGVESGSLWTMNDPDNKYNTCHNDKITHIYYVCTKWIFQGKLLSLDPINYKKWAPKHCYIVVKLEGDNFFMFEYGINPIQPIEPGENTSKLNISYIGSDTFEDGLDKSMYTSDYSGSIVNVPNETKVNVNRTLHEIVLWSKEFLKNHPFYDASKYVIKKNKENKSYCWEFSKELFNYLQ